MTPSGRYVWFSMEVRAVPPAVEDTIAVTCQVRKAVLVHISLTNPVKEHLEFHVNFSGHGVFGLDHLRLGPEETKQYELVFSPLITGMSEGSVHFVNELAGAFGASRAWLPSDCVIVIASTAQAGGVRLIFRKGGNRAAVAEEIYPLQWCQVEQESCANNPLDVRAALRPLLRGRPDALSRALSCAGRSTWLSDPCARKKIDSKAWGLRKRVFWSSWEQAAHLCTSVSTEPVICLVRGR